MWGETQDVLDVREATARYVDATYRGDVGALRACFHESAVMSGYLGEELLTGSPEPFFNDIAAARRWSPRELPTWRR